MAGLAGGLQVYHVQFVSPGDLNAVASAKVLLMAILGGSATFVGPIIGAFVVVLLENLVSGWMERWVMVLGIIYIFVVMVTPAGLMGEIVRWSRKGGKHGSA
jgi:branched-chain amino acid transport system permease protein